MASAGCRKVTALAVDEQLAAARPLGAREDVEQLVLALALEGDDAEHLARVAGRRSRRAASSRAVSPRAVIRGCRPRSSRAAAVRSATAGIAPDDLAEHQLDDPVLGALRHVDDADGLALAQDRGAVAHRRDLDHAMGDEDDRPIAAALAADHLEDTLGQVGGQGRGHLVEHQHVGLDRQRAGEVDDPERGQRQVPGEARQVEVAGGRAPQSQWRNGSTGVAVEPQVVPDVEVRDQRRFLVDGDEPVAAGLGRRMRQCVRGRAR